MSTIFYNGRYLKVNPQVVDVFTPGVFRAQGVFETMLALDGRVMDADLHIKRLGQGLGTLGISLPLIDHSIFKKLLASNKLSCARVRLMVWQAQKQTHVMAMALPYQFSKKETYRVCVISVSRAANGRLANVKSLDYGLYAGAYARARAQGFDEALLRNRRGHIFEASRANIFWVKDAILYTPPLSSGCLKGITRQQVISQARLLKTVVKEKNLTLETLKKADAAFLTNSLAGIKPIDLREIKIA